MNAHDLVVAGRVRMLFSSVFFGTLATHMRLVETDNVPTMGVDGVSLFFNPEFVKKLSKKEIEAVLCHEVMHLVLLTHLRRGSRDMKLWNIATDFAINILLKDQGFMLPDGCLFDEKYRDWSAEKIYNYLEENPGEQPGGEEWNVGGVMDGGTGGDDGKEGSKPAMSQSQIEVEVGKVKAMIQAAAMSAKKAGQLNGTLEKLIEGVCAPRANWRTLLQRFIAEKAFCDWEYNKSNTRMLHQYGIVSPVLGGEKLGNLALIIDTSGSVDDEQLAQFASEISDVVEQYPCTVTAIYIDTQINHIETFTEDDLPLQLHCVGRGGTAAKLGYEYVEENLSDCVALIHFTDSQVFDWNEIEEPHCPALIAHTEKYVAKDTPDWLERVDISE